MKYKVGDKVRIKSLDWYNENKDMDGYVPCGKYDFVPHMSVFCGKILTIDVDLEDETYLMKGNTNGFIFTDEMIEGLVEEEISQNAKLVSERFAEYVNPSEFKYAQDTITKMLLQGANIPNEYILKDENGNTINATKIVLEKKKKEYPKTYEECCEALEYIPHTDDIIGYKWNILQSLQKLLICRDAYWKIAGEEMGLDKPWEPDWKDDTTHKFIIHTIKDKIHCGVSLIKNHLLAFPTEEMRDAFYENFKELIESVKELL